MTEIINQQRKYKIDTGEFLKFTERVATVVDEARGKHLTVAFVSDRKIRELNKIFREKNKPTDVLSFPFEADAFDLPETANFLGEIAVSVETADRQAAENNLSLEAEIKQLILHGVLHLCGYDHETDAGEMNGLELKFRDKLQI